MRASSNIDSLVVTRETELRAKIVVAPSYLYAEIQGRAERQAQLEILMKRGRLTFWKYRTYN